MQKCRGHIRLAAQLVYYENDNYTISSNERRGLWPVAPLPLDVGDIHELVMALKMSRMAFVEIWAQHHLYLQEWIERVRAGVQGVVGDPVKRGHGK